MHRLQRLLFRTFYRDKVDARTSYCCTDRSRVIRIVFSADEEWLYVLRW